MAFEKTEQLTFTATLTISDNGDRKLVLRAPAGEVSTFELTLAGNQNRYALKRLGDFICRQVGRPRGIVKQQTERETINRIFGI
jgi:hypothetical protein